MEVAENKLWNIISTADPNSSEYKQAEAKLDQMAGPEIFLFYGGILAGALGTVSLIGLLIAGIKEGSTTSSI